MHTWQCKILFKKWIIYKNRLIIHTCFVFALIILWILFLSIKLATICPIVFCFHLFILIFPLIRLLVSCRRSASGWSKNTCTIGFCYFFFWDIFSLKIWSTKYFYTISGSLNRSKSNWYIIHKISNNLVSWYLLYPPLFCSGFRA